MPSMSTQMKTFLAPWAPAGAANGAHEEPEQRERRRVARSSRSEIEPDAELLPTPGKRRDRQAEIRGLEAALIRREVGRVEGVEHLPEHRRRACSSAASRSC